MTIEAEIAALTTSTTSLLNAVNVSKTTLDQKKDDAAASAAAAAVSETNAATSEANAATSETNAAGSATAAAASASGASTSATAAGNSASNASASASSASSSATSAATSATTATNAASAATAASVAINVTANVSAWVSGTTYALGTVVYSPINWQNYRRIVAGAGTTDPSQDFVNWTAVGFGPSDVGTAPNQIPLNQYLGTLAYVDSLSIGLEPGAGVTLGVGTICQGTFVNNDGVKTTTIVMDLTGLRDGGTAGDIIGSNSTAVNGVKQPAYVAQLPAGFTVLGGRMTCLETPAGGGTDIDLYSATEGTGVQDDAISGLTETQIVNGGAQTVGTVSYFAADPAASSYLYMVSQGTGAAAYTAGRFLIEIFGV